MIRTPASTQEEDGRKRHIVGFKLPREDLDRLTRQAKADGYESPALWARDVILAVMVARESAERRRQEGIQRRARGDEG